MFLMYGDIKIVELMDIVDNYDVVNGFFKKTENLEKCMDFLRETR